MVQGAQKWSQTFALVPSNLFTFHRLMYIKQGTYWLSEITHNPAPFLRTKPLLKTCPFGQGTGMFLTSGRPSENRDEERVNVDLRAEGTGREWILTGKRPEVTKGRR